MARLNLERKIAAITLIVCSRFNANDECTLRPLG